MKPKDKFVGGRRGVVRQEPLGYEWPGAYFVVNEELATSVRNAHQIVDLD